MKRLGIYLFYEKDGIADGYIPYFLARFKPFLRELCIVVNGKLTPKSRAALEPFADKILLRENTGFDAWAYKDALEHYGYDKLQSFDEVILCNYTFFGPFYPLENLFADMDKKDCDWWSLYRWYEKEPVDYQHIPSFWVAYRRSLVASPDFKHYWDTLHPIHSYADSTVHHEQRQAPYYDQKGYRCATWIDHDQYKPYWQEHWPISLGHLPVIQNKYPFVKRRTFFVEDGEVLFPQVAAKLIPFLRRHTDYDVRLIWDNLRRTQPLESLSRVHSAKLFARAARYALSARLHPSARRRRRYGQKFHALLLNKEKLENLFFAPLDQLPGE